MAAMTKLEKACEDKGLKMTEQRRVIARVIADAEDHPDVETVYRRATAVDPRISIATVYRSLKLFEDANVLVRHDFGEGRARYEETGDHHEHLIDIETGDRKAFAGNRGSQRQADIAHANHAYTGATIVNFLLQGICNIALCHGGIL